MVVQLETALERYKDIILKSNMAGELENLKGLLSGI